LVGITAQGKGLVLVILRYADELRKPEPYFEKIEARVSVDAVKLAVDLIEERSGKFEPKRMPNEYARAIHELVQAKVEQRAPEVTIESERGETPKVVNIMDALRKSMQARGVGPRSAMPSEPEALQHVAEWLPAEIDRAQDEFDLPQGVGFGLS
jgi:DNA end-binding protein Ku